MLETARCNSGPSRRIAIAGTQIFDRPLMTEPFYRTGQLMVFRDELLKVFPPDFQQVGMRCGLDRRRTGFSAQHRHFAERLSFAKLCELSCRVAIDLRASVRRKNVNFALRDYVERVSRVARMEEKLAIV